ncbi:MAG: pyruvate, phosphate dikinase [Puniceicoccales bacterium]|jgi:pyruvate,orthophosphate dikinase|nr:pyruvate, phosphate dikinase [Puniceicoccales bacterium]
MASTKPKKSAGTAAASQGALKKPVYAFGAKTDGNAAMRPLLGGKGANLAEMARIGLPVPPGFTITTEVCTHYYANKRSYPAGLFAKDVPAAIHAMEKQTGKKFGDAKNFPLLVSVRSGARDSMPGMMDTILNLGINDETVVSLARATNNARFAWDCYRRFIQMYGDVVLGVQKRTGEDHEPFETVISTLKKERLGDAEAKDTDLDPDALQELVRRFKALVKERTGKAFPTDPWKQLEGAVGAVFSSWMNDRAIVYRRKYNIPAEWGTAVNVQAMVFGNTGDNSGSGVAFTRDPASGEKVFYGEFLINAQGEDVVAGVRTPAPVHELEKVLPGAHKELERIRKILEEHFRDMQDFEFTIEDGRVYMLQTRNGKRTGLAAVRIAAEMVKERLIDWETAVTRVPADQLDQVLAPVFDPAALKAAKATIIAKGLPAGPGAATGRVYFNADRAVEAAARGEKVLLARAETSPEDLRGMIAAEGILTARGGVSSHAALVARQMGKVCVCGAANLDIDYAARVMRVSGAVYNEGDYLSIDGTTGEVYPGQIKTADSDIIRALLKKDAGAKKTPAFQNYAQLMDWCAKATRLKVYTNADTPEQTAAALAFGAEGIGLTRTEHMFFEGDRIDAMREMILAADTPSRKAALAKLLPYQRDDFAGIFKALAGLPATIRLLDPPLHEFLPHTKEQQLDLARKLGIPVETIMNRVAALHEFNPMLGHRGCRLGIAYPEITEMQARAIFEAAIQTQKKGLKARPEIMVPLVGFKRELDLQVEIIHRVASEVSKEHKTKLDYKVGTMIEVPRGAITADEIAQTAQFFSFGTNDLTQTTLGMSRDDSGNFLGAYTEAEIVKRNPFATLDQTGVGQIMRIAVEKGRATRPDIKLGICGEHGGDPDSVKFCHKLGIAYVSCSPFRVPTARLAAAQAAIEEKKAANGANAKSRAATSKTASKPASKASKK